MRQKDLETRLQGEMEQWGYDFSQFTLESFKTWVEGCLQRTIVFIPTSATPRLHGLWLSDAEDPYEYIFYDKDAPPILQIHTQLHELAHILCGHQTWNITHADLIAVAQGKQDLKVYLPLVLARRSKETIEEQEAETLAALIQKTVIRYDHIDELTTILSSSHDIAAHLKTLEIG